MDDGTGHLSYDFNIISSTRRHRRCRCHRRHHRRCHSELYSMLIKLIILNRTFSSMKVILLCLVRI